MLGLQEDEPMTALVERVDLMMPSEKDVEYAAHASRVLAPRAKADLRVHLDDGQELTLPKTAARLLTHILAQMASGNAVTLIPVHAELTTQEAAGLLNVSRPHLIKLIDSGEIPHHKVGTHRRIKFTDLQAYRNKFEEERRKAMEELAAQAQELGMGY
jgi:excisionase family DNA binding protein